MANEVNQTEDISLESIGFNPVAIAYIVKICIFAIILLWDSKQVLAGHKLAALLVILAYFTLGFVHTYEYFNPASHEATHTEAKADVNNDAETCSGIEAKANMAVKVETELNDNVNLKPGNEMETKTNDYNTVPEQSLKPELNAITKSPSRVHRCVSYI